jgi:predicted KAP-like P-loop ATPase
MALLNRIFPWFKGSSQPALSAGIPTDAPILNADQDILGRSGFASEIAEVIANQRTTEGVVLALRGDWGSGKSSLKNLIVQDLGRRFAEKVNVLEFNPWDWGSDEAINHAFFSEIAAALGQADNSLTGRRRAYKFLQYAELLATLSGSFKSSGDWASSIVGWLTIIGLLTTGVSLALLGSSATKIATGFLIFSGIFAIFSKVFRLIGVVKYQDKPLELVRADLKDRLKTLPVNLLIVIDDIDRLEAQQIRLLIRLVKSNSNLPGITYLLLFEQGIVEDALDPDQHDRGRRYLEKIVQASFDVPTVERARVEAELINGLNRLLINQLTVENGFDVPRWQNIWQSGIRHLFCNIRDVRRFISVFGIHLNLQQGRSILEINIIDFIAIEALRIFEPEIFKLLSREKTLLTQKSNNQGDFFNRINEIIDSTKFRRKSAVRDILVYLFPKTSDALKVVPYYSDNDTKLDQDRRICSRRHFDRYFMLRLPDGQISNSDLKDFLELNDKSEIAKAFQAFDRDDLLPILLARLDETKEILPQSNIGSLLPAIIDVGDKYEDFTGLSVSGPFIAAWRVAAWCLKGVSDASSRDKIFREALENSSGLGVPEMLIKLDENSRRNIKTDYKAIFTDQGLNMARELILEKIREVSKEPEIFLNNHHIIPLLYRWRAISDDNEPRRWIAGIVKRVHLLPKLLDVFTIIRESQTIGQYSVQKTKVFYTEWFKDFADLDQVNKALERIDISLLPQAEKDALLAYNEAVSDISNQSDAR